MTTTSTVASSRVEAGKYKVLYGSYEFCLERLRDSGTSARGCWTWYLYGMNVASSALIHKRGYGPLLGGNRSMKEALDRIPNLVKDYETNSGRRS